MNAPWTPLLSVEERALQAKFVNMLYTVCRRVATESGPHVAEQILMEDYDRWSHGWTAPRRASMRRLMAAAVEDAVVSGALQHLQPQPRCTCTQQVA